MNKPQYSRPMPLAMMTSVVALLGVLGTSACRRDGIPEGSAKPLRYTPRSGPIEGGQLVFIEVEEPASAIGRASIACRFGGHPAGAGEYDAASGRYICRTPAHRRPEAVTLTIELGRAEFPMPDRYLYTTFGLGQVPVAEIDIAAFQKQVKRVRDQLPTGVRLCAVLKNSEPIGWLGEAITRVAKVDYFGVARMQDGIALREAGVKEPIVVFYLTEVTHVPELLHYNLEPAAYSLAWVEEANRLLQRARGTLKVHLWIDTGLSREGVMPDEALALARAVAKCPKLHLQGIATHFCCLGKGDLAEIEKGNLKNQTALQKHRFDEVVNAIHAAGIGRDAIIHAGSSDVLRYGMKPVYYDMLRIGSLLHENPVSERPNYSWKTRILQIKTLSSGWCVGYDCKVRVKADTRVGLVANIPDHDVAYYVHGQKVPVLLDEREVIVLDVSHVPDVREGDEVTLIMDKNEPNSPLDASELTPVTLRDEARSGEGE